MRGEEDTGGILVRGWRERVHLKESEQIELKDQTTDGMRIRVCENKVSQLSPEPVWGLSGCQC